MQYMKCMKKEDKKGSMVQSYTIEKIAKHRLRFTAFDNY